MKKIIALMALFLLFGCSTPPVPTAAPGATVTPSGSAQSPVPAAVPTEDVPFLPNPAWQPGANNPDVTQDNIQTTICVSGYSSKIRPPVSYTDKLKKKQIVQYGYTDTNLADYEEDHLVSLEIGGHPTDPQNLWPQPRHTQPWNASIKDTVENVLHGMICSGQLPLDTARQAIATDWVAAYQKYVPHSLFALTPVPPEP